MNIRKGLTVLVAGAALALLPVLPSTAAHAAVGCTFTVHSVTARNLIHDGGTDEVAIRLDRTWFPSSGWVNYSGSLPVTHSSGFGSPSMGVLTDIDVRLTVNGWPANHPMDHNFQCNPASHDVYTFSTNNGDAVYDVEYSIT